MPIALPAPTPVMIAHTDKLNAYIRHEITSKGPLPFARFMELALYAPDLGYYASDLNKFGKNGDFVTAPECSALFSRAVARQVAAILATLPCHAAILELGAGSGRFAQDLLLALEQHQQLPAQYLILETSASLKIKQQHLLATQSWRQKLPIVWLDTLPQNFCGVIIANEVLDALPFHCLTLDGANVYERCVSFVADTFNWVLTTPSSAALLRQAKEIVTPQLPAGYETEINLAMPIWLTKLAQTLSQGVMLLFDYGYEAREYYHPHRNTGSLRCYYQQRCHNNPLILVGLQDITANVNFSTVATTVMNAGLELLGYTSQSAFLLNSGIADMLIPEDTAQFAIAAYQQSQELKTLLLPSEMGSLIKVLACGKNWPHQLAAFAQFDLSHRL